MAMAPAALFRGTMTATLTTTLYTVPGATTAVITDIVVANRTGTAATFTLDFDTFYIANAVNIPANSIVTFDMKQVLATGKLIRGGSGTASALDVHISGALIT